MHVLSPTAGRYTVKLSYIAADMNWSADYVARVNADGKTLDLTGWITLVNATDTSFANAPTEVVAGHLNLTGDDPAVLSRAAERHAAMLADGHRHEHACGCPTNCAGGSRADIR